MYYLCITAVNILVPQCLRPGGRYVVSHTSPRSLEMFAFVMH